MTESQVRRAHSRPPRSAEAAAARAPLTRATPIGPQGRASAAASKMLAAAVSGTRVIVLTGGVGVLRGVATARQVLLRGGGARCAEIGPKNAGSMSLPDPVRTPTEHGKAGHQAGFGP